MSGPLFAAMQGRDFVILRKVVGFGVIPIENPQPHRRRTAKSEEKSDA
jgi:hypothetical protein